MPCAVLAGKVTSSRGQRPQLRQPPATVEGRRMRFREIACGGVQFASSPALPHTLRNVFGLLVLGYYFCLLHFNLFLLPPDHS